MSLDIKKGMPFANGTFLQADMARYWDDETWKREFDYLKEAGMEYLVLTGLTTTTGEVTQTLYPSNVPGANWENKGVDTVLACLKSARAAGLKVFLGINFNSAWWKKGVSDPAWLYAQMERGKTIAGELYHRYYTAYSDAFYGWYWEYEIDNRRFRNARQLDILARALEINLSCLKENGQRIPFLLSPFMNKRSSTPEQYADCWSYLFSQTGLGEDDIFCPQDCVGAGGLEIPDVPTWFAALAQAAARGGLRFWANVETFDQRDWSSAVLNRFIRQLANVAPYAEQMLTFSYSHYYSPTNIARGFHDSYLEYLRNGFLQQRPPLSPEQAEVRQVGAGKFLISWEPSQDSAGVYGYRLYRNKKPVYITKAQRKYGSVNPGPVLRYLDRTNPLSFVPATYCVEAFDFAGNVSGLTFAKLVQEG